MTSGALNPPAPVEAETDVDPEGVVPDHVLCIRCGYQLLGLDPRRPCPECGLLVGMSLLDGEELRHNRPKWLVKLSVGAALCAAAILLSPAISPGAVMIAESPRSVWGVGGPRPLLDWIQWGLGLAIAATPLLLLLVGCFLLVSRAGFQRVDGTHPSMRRWLRILAAVPLVILIIMALSVANLLPEVEEEIGFTITFGGIGLLGVLIALLFFHLRGLARRAPAPLLAADSPIVGIFVALALFTPAVLGLAAYFEVEVPGMNTDLGMVLLGVWMSICLTATLWSVYLLIRYAIAFAKSAAQARDLMRQFDAAHAEP